MKRWLGLPLLVALLSVGLFSCGKDEVDRSSPPPAPTEEASGEPTDGRLGPAVRQRNGHAREKLDSGGKIDPTKSEDPNARREGVGAGAACPYTDQMPSGTNDAEIITGTLCLINGVRRDKSLSQLSQNGQLAQAAANHSADMVTKRYFAHAAQDGSDVADRVRATGYLTADSWTVGENLAWGTGQLATPVQIMIAWMNSQGHRENILNTEYREIGIGVIAGNPESSGGATYTTAFGTVDRQSTTSKRNSKGTCVVKRSTRNSGQKSSSTSRVKKGAKRCLAKPAPSARR